MSKKEKLKNISNDNLARMIQQGFDELSSRIDANRREMHDEFTALRGQIVHLPEFHDLVERVEKLEKAK